MPNYYHYTCYLDEARTKYYEVSSWNEMISNGAKEKPYRTIKIRSVNVSPRLEVQMSFTPDQKFGEEKTQVQLHTTNIWYTIGYNSHDQSGFITINRANYDADYFSVEYEIPHKLARGLMLILVNKMREAGEYMEITRQP